MPYQALGFVFQVFHMKLDVCLLRTKSLHCTNHYCFRCRICGGKFASLLAKNRHMLREHGSRSKIIKAAARPETADTVKSETGEKSGRRLV